MRFLGEGAKEGMTAAGRETEVDEMFRYSAEEGIELIKAGFKTV